MNSTRAGMRGIAPIFIIAVVALFTLGSAAYFSAHSTPAVSEEQRISTSETATEPPKQIVADVPRDRTAALPAQTSDSSAGLRAELEIALRSGGISPTRFKETQREIDALATRGVNVTDLRTLLAKFAVGDATKPAPPTPPPTSPKEEAPRIETRPLWEYDPSQAEKGWYWVREGEPSPCPDPLVLEAPIDVNLASGILYPGQVRGDGPEDFKPHGGFAMKSGDRSVTLRAPMDGYLTAVAKLTDEFGLHYGLTFQHPCGIQFGGGHFGALPPDIQTVVDTVPMKGFGESATEPIAPPYFVKKGQVIVTGLQEGGPPDRTGFDWGVADYRQPNAASKDPRFQELYGYAPWNTYYGVCWLDLLQPEQQTIVRGLPGVDGKQGKNSEYCK